MPTLTDEQAADLFRREPDILDVGSARLAYRRVGAGPHVLFVHGWPVSGATFRTLLPHLVDRVTCHIIDLPAAGSSPIDGNARPSIDGHIAAVSRAVDLIGVDDLAVVAHDSGGLIARHALAGDPRVRTFVLMDTEMPRGVSWRFRMFLRAGNLPGFGSGLRWALHHPAVTRNPLVFGAAFADRSLLTGEFDEFFLAPLRDDPRRLEAALSVLRSFRLAHIDDLSRAHRRIEVPVRLIWGAKDPFFPVERARTVLPTLALADLEVIPDASLFAHEERPDAVAAALLPAVLDAR